MRMMECYSIEGHRKLDVECILEDGSIVPYDAAAKTMDYYNPEIFELIGRGVIYSVNGKVYNYDPEKDKEYFFRRIG